MAIAINKVAALATITGREPMQRPKINHSRMPVQMITYISKDMSLVECDFQALMSCGRNPAVVSVPAIKPRRVILSIVVIEILLERYSLSR